MNGFWLTLILLLAAVAAFFVGRHRAVHVSGNKPSTLHSRPSYYGAYLAIWTALPAIILLGLWFTIERPVLQHLIEQDLPASVQSTTVAEKSLTLGVIRSVASGITKLSPEEYEVVRKARYGFVTPDDARDVLAKHGVVLGAAPQRYLLVAADDHVYNQRLSQNLVLIPCLLLAIGGFAWDLPASRGSCAPVTSSKA